MRLGFINIKLDSEETGEKWIIFLEIDSESSAERSVPR
jgi:hypothetical protein